jgi:hypothetical protein
LGMLRLAMRRRTVVCDRCMFRAPFSTKSIPAPKPATCPPRQPPPTPRSLPVTFIEPSNGFFWRRQFYGASDDLERFMFFARAALEWLLASGKQPDILHLHDWQSAAVVGLPAPAGRQRTSCRALCPAPPATPLRGPGPTLRPARSRRRRRPPPAPQRRARPRPAPPAGPPAGRGVPWPRAVAAALRLHDPQHRLPGLDVPPLPGKSRPRPPAHGPAPPHAGRQPPRLRAGHARLQPAARRGGVLGAHHHRQPHLRAGGVLARVRDGGAGGGREAPPSRGAGLGQSWP